MRIITELIGAIVLLLIFAYGVTTTIKFISKRENDNVSDSKSTERPERTPDAGTGHEYH